MKAFNTRTRKLSLSKLEMYVVDVFVHVVIKEGHRIVYINLVEDSRSKYT